MIHSLIESTGNVITIDQIGTGGHQAGSETNDADLPLASNDGRRIFTKF